MCGFLSKEDAEKYHLYLDGYDREAIPITITEHEFIHT